MAEPNNAEECRRWPELTKSGGTRELASPGPIERFVDQLRKLDRGDLAALRRNAGNTIGQSRNAMSLFYRILPREKADSWDEEIYFLIATLFPLNRGELEGNFGVTMRAVKAARKGSEAVDRRMGILLDSEFDRVDNSRYGGGEMAYRLRQCVKLADSNGIGVDWEKLLEDLVWWSHPSRRVRKEWARSYFGEPRETKSDVKSDVSQGGDY